MWDILKRRTTWGLVFLVATSFAGGLVVDRLLVARYGTTGPSLRDTDAGFTFIKPLLVCGSIEEEPDRTYDNLQVALTQKVQENIARGNLDHASIYFRDLLQGKWTGVNVEEEYTPASLIKVPIMIALFRQAEIHPEILAQTIKADPDKYPVYDQEIAPRVSVVSGRTYTIDELIRLMIVYSDNRASEMLLDVMDQNQFIDVLHDLGITIPESGPYAVSTHDYSFFFRILYNATYLSREMSERALRLLSESDYANGLRAGTPDDVLIAHKFGEAGDTAGDEVVGYELHDCGIVYQPDHEYLLCVMTKGNEVEKLETFIHEVSEEVFTWPK